MTDGGSSHPHRWSLMGSDTQTADTRRCCDLNAVCTQLWWSEMRGEIKDSGMIQICLFFICSGTQWCCTAAVDKHWAEASTSCFINDGSNGVYRCWHHTLTDITKRLWTYSIGVFILSLEEKNFGLNWSDTKPTASAAQSSCDRLPSCYYSVQTGWWMEAAPVLYCPPAFRPGPPPCY